MISFKYRSDKRELLDNENIPFEHIKRNMQELNTINHYLGGHQITLAGLKYLISDFKSDTIPLHIVEIGCGGGDNLRVIKEWAQKHKQSIHLTGIDINPECINFAQSIKANQDITFINSDYKEVEFDPKPHIIFCSLFCHHFKEEELTAMIQWMKANSRLGFYINDLHRHPLAFYSIKILTALFSRSYMVKHDAPLSVQRGFKRRDWKELFIKAGIPNYSCEWKWAFRWLVTYIH